MASRQSTPRLDRELSWLAFNHRVLQEAADPSVPVFDRLGFLAIFSSNLDEFFRVRVAALRAHVRRSGRQGGRAAALLRRIREAAVRHQTEFGRVLRQEVLPELGRHGIHLADEASVPEGGREWLAAHFREQIASHLAPVVLGDGDAPFLKDRTVYLVVELFAASPPSDAPRFGMVEVPGGAARFVALPGQGAPHTVLFVDDVIRLFASGLFPGWRTGASWAVKLSRDADLYVHEDPARSIAEAVRRSLPRRETGLPCRFLYDEAAPAAVLDELTARFSLSANELVPGGRYHNLHDLHAFPRFGRGDLASEPLAPLPHPALEDAPSVLAAVAARDRVLHFPYQSYAPVLRFLAEAAADAAVEEVWITLYRVAPQSAVVQALVDAARAGKRVTAVVEVQARFDEAANLEWAARMEAAGVRVIHGLPGLKVHAKLVLVARREGERVRDYVLLSTGNFNERTARIYADHALMTADARLTSEVRAVFARLSGEGPPPVTEHLLVAPVSLRRGLHRLVEREIEHARAGRPARIVLKMNSLEDPEMIEALYRASAAGVRVDLVVRGICCLAAGVPEVSENIRARSIVDRFLEHARVFVFHDGGRDHVYLASADWMTRNLSRRVEVAFPLLDEAVRREVLTLLDFQLEDDTKARVLDPGLRNTYVPRVGDTPVRAQIESYRFLETVPPEPEGTAGDRGQVTGDSRHDLSTSQPTHPHPTDRPMTGESPVPEAVSVVPPSVERDEDGKDKKEKDKPKKLKLAADKSVDTLFRTSYRMHVEMTGLADSKANIMISINGLMISIILAAISPKIAANPWLLLPTAVVLLGSLSSLAYAVLAARPRVRTGTPADAGKRANLLFFGSFVSLSPSEYEAGVEELMRDPLDLYKSMARDLYGLGKVLERKFDLLRRSYTVFLAGLAVGVILYLVVYLLIALAPQATTLPPA